MTKIVSDLSLLVSTLSYIKFFKDKDSHTLFRKIPGRATDQKNQRFNL